MALKLIHMDVDLRKYPDDISPLTKDDEVTLGDGHGNALKMVYFLIKTGIMTLAGGAEDYQRLVEIYEQELNPEANDYAPYAKAMDDFIRILHQAKPGLVGILRFLGDVVADRGNNDLYTLLIYEWLLIAKIRVETMMSNHDMAFISLVLNGEYSPNIALTVGYDRLRNHQMRSAFGALFFLYHKLFPEERFIHLFSLYRSTLSLFACSKGDDDELILYTHAPVGLETLYAFYDEYRSRMTTALLATLHLPEEAEHAKTRFYHLGSGELAKVIDAVNAVFASLDLRKAIDSERCYLEIFYRDGLPQRMPMECPLFRLCWNRDTTQLQAGTRVKLTLIHGHDLASPSFGKSLDNFLGKNSKGGLINLVDPWYTLPQGGLPRLNVYRYGSLALPSTPSEKAQLSYAVVNSWPEAALKKRPSIIGFFEKNNDNDTDLLLPAKPLGLNLHL
ncbi:hypothetical protein DIZ81_02495 [Legionella taurinensis]|uniref:WipA-like phosphatase domain-containing protein n=1 Tax=Legionella taurinensis TaxID=70611 RepID=A0A3A5L470_9GAMM|nr:hypothetical protein [Legionella taurinensis]MDX1836258.1 hypothetical protein [Legionella taurinensis]PUT41983.1 hypothetical protein DB744_02500 [Legionella taurinensis]PUT44771.1 hypothetical protein DB746_02500 [Legionella taurinensis]PUT48092.1 hypothetical protein DB743_00660 [Legionella taurinensis]PUT48906.1 hypothetical protein DB745_02500 [Legionella taurinensis]